MLARQNNSYLLGAEFVDPVIFDASPFEQVTMIRVKNQIFLLKKMKQSGYKI
jgi:hypothetical protein